MPEGIDRAVPFTDGAVLDCLRSNGITFIGRYYKPRRDDGSISSYLLTRKEAQLISSKGFYIVAVYQDYGRRASNYTYEKGIDDYMEAAQRAAEVGQPADSPIYFAVDFDAAGAGELDNIRAYFRGILECRESMRLQGKDIWRLGVYGGIEVVEHIASAFPEVEYKWQTVSWSRGKVTDYNLYQYRIDVDFPSCPRAGKVDRVRSNGNGGGFRVN